MHAHTCLRSAHISLMPSCPHALMPSCPHALMPSCLHALMPSCPRALMPSCRHRRRSCLTCVAAMAAAVAAGVLLPLPPPPLNDLVGCRCGLRWHRAGEEERRAGAGRRKCIGCSCHLMLHCIAITITDARIHAWERVDRVRFVWEDDPEVLDRYPGIPTYTHYYGQISRHTHLHTLIWTDIQAHTLIHSYGHLHVCFRNACNTG